MATPSRPSVPSASSAARQGSVKPLAPKRRPPSPWSPACLFLAAAFGLFAIFLCSVTILGENEYATFMTFLKGQIGFSTESLSSSLFWKITVSFLLGAGGGYLAGLELPREHMELANRIARFMTIVVLTLVVYIPAMSAGFLWDDDQEITANSSLTSNYGLWEIWTGGITNDLGAKPDDPFWVNLSRPPLRAIETALFGNTEFKAKQSADYFPLKTTMLWIEFQLWGRNADGSPNPHPFHVVNIVLHMIDALLLWLLLSQLKVPGAWFASLLFAIHPVHVESVAWIAERKNTLSLFFYLLSLSAWVHFEDTEKRKYYITSFLLCIASLLCKTSVVVLPAVLLLCTWWRTGKLTVRDAIRTAPFFVISLFLSYVTVWFQNGRAIGQEVIPFGDRISQLAGAGFSSFWYLEKSLLPLHLNTIYTAVPILPPDGPQASQFIKGAVVLLILAAFFVYYLIGKKRSRVERTPFFVLAYFLGTLFPVLGFFKMSYMRVALQADHFQYLSDLSIVAALGALAYAGWERASASVKPVIIGACTLLVVTFSAYSWERAGVHQSEMTLWTACLTLNEASWQAHNHLGAQIYMQQRVAEAQYHFQRAVDLKPANPEVHNNLGLTLAAYGHMEEALAQYRKAVEIKGDVPQMRRNLADCLARMEHFEEAVEQYKIIVEAEPRDAAAHSGYGVALVRLKRFDEAKVEFEKAYSLDPTNPQARQNLEAVKAQLRGVH